MSKTNFEVADVFNAGFEKYYQEFGLLPKEHYDVANAIMACHTSKMGGHVYRCEQCSHDIISYNGCRNRHCPSCQGTARAQWVQNRIQELLPVSYFHVVFTIPSQLNPFVLRNKQCCYALLFKAASETLLELARDVRHLGALSGFICVLHTWGQNLLDHPHLHCIVPNGGLAGDEWVNGKNKDFLLPVHLVCELFKGKFMAYFKNAVLSGEIVLHGDLQMYEKDRSKLQKLFDCCYSLFWNVYLEPPFGSPEQVLKYIGRYTHRVAIANNRITSVTATHVTFRWKDYRDHDRTKDMVLTHAEFIRRFLMHVLPKGFVKIRYYGFLSAPLRKKSLQFCRDQLLNEKELCQHELVNCEETREEKMSEPVRFKCPVCGSDKMHRHRELARTFSDNGTSIAA